MHADGAFVPTPLMITHDLMGVADAFLRHLTSPWLRYGEDEIEVIGSLSMEPAGPDARVFTGCHWMISHPWRARCPRVFCDASWITRGGADWHLNVDGSLCYVHPQQWCECAGRLVKTIHGTNLSQIFADFAYNNLRWLLQCHLEAHRLGLTAWPAAWPQWLHGATGSEQYRREGSAALDQMQIRPFSS